MGVAVLLSSKAAAIVLRLAAIGCRGAGILFNEAPGFLTMSPYLKGTVPLACSSSSCPIPVHQTRSTHGGFVFLL